MVSSDRSHFVSPSTKQKPSHLVVEVDEESFRRLGTHLKTESYGVTGYEKEGHK